MPQIASIFRQHADIFNIVQFTEDAQLRELGDARQEYEAKVGVAGFERTIEITHDVAEDGQVFFFMHHVEQGRVVFVDEHHHLAARLFAGPADKVCKTCVRIGDVRFDAEIPFQCLQLPQQVAFQSFLVQMLAHAHVEVQHGIFRPLRFPLFRWPVL